MECVEHAEVAQGFSHCHAPILIFAGYVGGNHYLLAGGAANHLCLPEEPQYATTKAKVENTATAVLFGAEYQTHTKHDIFPGKHDKDVPCAVCLIPARSTALMIPARTSCYPGFHLEYKGYLMAGSFWGTKAASEFICVDEQAEAVPGGESNKDGDLLWMVESRCGSLRCPPYKNGAELSCVVCSK